VSRKKRTTQRGQATIHLRTRTLSDAQAAFAMDSLELESPAQVKEFWEILWRTHPEGHMTEAAHSEALGAYHASLSMHALRLAGFLTFEVQDPLDMDEAHAIATHFDRLESEDSRLPEGLTLADMDGLYRDHVQGKSP
jgi:hypothetical protein